MNILQACRHPEVFGPWFKNPATYDAWFAFLAALFGLPMTDEQLAIYRAHTGREEAPSKASTEAWLIIGRRGGKSFFMALIAVVLSTFRDYREFLAPGERATLMVIAADRRQARTIMRYVRAMVTEIPMLNDMVEGELRAEGLDLDNRVTIEVGTASYRSSRGYTFCGVLADEIAFWRTDDAAEPDYAILDAIRPGMSTAEYGAEFRSDLEAFVAREVVEACVTPGVHERAYLSAFKYRAFVDPSGGSSDSFTLVICHRESDRIVHDLTREKKPPFNAEATIKEFCDTLKTYRITEVEGDRYGGEFPREHFRKNGIAYRVADKVRTDLYINLLPNLNSGRVDLLDHPQMVNQLVGLERRVARGGRESIDHPRGGHDDIANGLAGAVWLCSEARKQPVALFGTYGSNAGRAIAGHSTHFGGN